MYMYRPITIFLLTGLATTATAQIVPYQDHQAFLDALAARGYSVLEEGFEDDVAWGSVRSTIAGGERTAATVSHLGVIWASSSSNNQITTGVGAARTGQWGIFSLPHGDYENGIGDGLSGTTANSLVAIGGWFQSNTPPAKLSLFLDGDEANPVDFGNTDFLDGQSRFFGVLNVDGFTRFDFRELEGTSADQKFIFADDFTFAFGGTVVDCNANGSPDGRDIDTGTSSDCDLDGIPDECEIDATSAAPGGPFFCTSNCSLDCNENGLPDECEVVIGESHASGELSPVGVGFPQSFTIAGAPSSRADVLLEFTAYANLGGAQDHIAVDINGVPVGTVFGPDGSDCPEAGPDEATIVVPRQTFNDAAGGGDAVIQLVASAEVNAEECGLPTYVTVTVTLFVSSDLDADGNGVPDECDAALARFLRADCNEDGQVDLADAVCILGWLFLGNTAPGCVAVTNTNGDASIDVSDAVYVLMHLFLGGPAPVEPFPLCGPGLLPTDAEMGCDAPPAFCAR